MQFLSVLLIVQNSYSISPGSVSFNVRILDMVVISSFYYCVFCMCPPFIKNNKVLDF